MSPVAGPDVHAATANRLVYRRDGASDYQGHRYHRTRLALAVQLLAEQLVVPGATRAPVVADLGSGGGAAEALLAERGLRPIACDVLPGPVRRAAADGRAAVQLDAAAGLPFGSGSLDGILAGELIEHLFDPAALLRECCRVLRPGGLLVITTPNLAGVQDRWRFLSGRAPRQVDPFHEYLYLHIRPFTYRLLATGLRAAGLMPVRVVSNYVVWRTRFCELRSRRAARRWPTLGGSLVIGAVRPERALRSVPATGPAPRLRAAVVLRSAGTR
jgi:SAM-dependent methyltransferase